MNIVSRAAFGWGPSAASSARPDRGIVIHYDGSNIGLAGKPHSECRDYWIRTRKFHMGPSRGWADLGYSWGCCPHGHVFEGRGLNRVQAAQPGGNSTWYSVTLMSGPKEIPTEEQINAVRELRAWLMGKGVGAAVKGHRDFISTSCLPLDSTDVLTSRGWVPLKDVSPHDLVASWAVDSDTVTFDHPADIIAPYQADTLVIDRFETTPDHNWITSGAKPGAVGCSCGYVGSPASIRAHGREGRRRGEAHETQFEERWKFVRADHMKRVDRYLGAVSCGGPGLALTDEQIRLVVWLQGDGHLMREARGRSPDPYGVEWHLKKPRKITRLAGLLHAMAIPFNRNERQNGTVSLRVYGDVAREQIISLLPDKRFTWDLMDLSPAQAEVFLEELMHVDGCQAGSYYSSADSLNLDVVQAIATLNGRVATRGRDPHTVMLRRRGGPRHGTRREVHNIEPGRRTLVGCLTTANGTLIARQHGRTIVIGNCPGDIAYRMVQDGTFAGATSWTETLVKELPTLRQGDDSWDVKTLRWLLGARGFVPEALGSTLFDEPLAKHVELFQQAKGLDADKIVGKLTWTALLRM